MTKIKKEHKAERKTVGQISSELAQKQPETTSVIELQREIQKDYIDNLVECAKNNLDKYQNNFYISVLTKLEPLMTNVFRNYFFATQACPTPNYDQAVYRFNRISEEIEFLWCLPSRDAAHHLMQNAIHVVPEERWLLDLVLQMSDGSLFKLAKKLNNERMDSPILEK